MSRNHYSGDGAFCNTEACLRNCVNWFVYTCNIFYLQMRFLICTTPSEVNDFIIYAKMACICGDFYVVFISHSWHWWINLWWAVVMDVQSHDPLCQDFDSSLSHSSPPAPSPRKSPNLLLLPSSSPQTN